MKGKKMKLSLRKLTIADLDLNAQDKVRGGSYPGCITVGSWCCTINVATCIPSPENCNPADTYQGPRTICP
jgi:hypothetical protein